MSKVRGAIQVLLFKIISSTIKHVANKTNSFDITISGIQTMSAGRFSKEVVITFDDTELTLTIVFDKSIDYIKFEDKLGNKKKFHVLSDYFKFLDSYLTALPFTNLHIQ